MLSGKIVISPFGVSVIATFEASTIVNITIVAPLVGAIIAKDGTNSKQFFDVTRMRLLIKEYESYTNLRNIKLEGTFVQIKQTNSMVLELTMKVKAAFGLPHANIIVGIDGASN